MSNETFKNAPAPSGGIDLNSYLGSLLLISVNGHEKGIQTAFGVNDAIRCDVVVLDGQLAGDEVADTLLFPRVLQNQLKGSIGSKVLGRLGKGQAKSGQSAPWLLQEATAQDQETARQWIAGNSAPQFSKPQTQAAAPF